MMAEGGISTQLNQEDSPVTGTRSYSLDSRLLECPICLEQLRQPKSLPCLHCFCQECLCSYILSHSEKRKTSDSAFQCPVCRKETQPVKSSEERQNWAKQFPTNSLIQDLIQLQSKAHSSRYCKPCEKKGNTESPALVWCKSMNMFFCGACRFSFHDVMHEGCDSLVSIGTDESLIQAASATVRCSKHKKKIDYYCEDHELLGCSKCITIDHRRCEVVMTTDEYCVKLENSSQHNRVMESLQEGADAINTLLKNFSGHLQRLTKQQDTCLKSITELRQKLNQCLDEMQQEITEELTKVINQERENLLLASQKCEKLKTSILNTLESSKLATRKNDKVETILLYQRGQTEIESCKDLVTEMGKMSTYLRVHHVTESETKATGKYTRINFGKIVVEKQQKHLCTGATKTSRPEFRVEQIRKFKIGYSSDKNTYMANGIVYLQENKIVVGDFFNSKLKLFTDKGDFKHEFIIWEGYPYDMCVVDDSTFGVAVANPGYIYVMKVKSSKLSLLYKMNGPCGNNCYGLTYKHGKFFVSSSSEVYEMVKDCKPELLYRLHASHFSLASDYKSGFIFASQCTLDENNYALYRMRDDTITGKVKVGNLKDAWGVDVDKEGNVYVCRRASRNIVQMDRDGTCIRELLTSSDGINNPRAIAVYGNKFAVTTDSLQKESYVCVYQIFS